MKLKAYLFALALLLPVAPASANFAIFQVAGPSASVPLVFQGNPNASVSAITPSIICSRSGTIQTPAFIQCSASPTSYTATGGSTSGAYDDLEYTWNFGDTSGTEVFTHPISGNTVNANSKQFGPEATYVYRQAGTYTVTLNVRGCANGPTIAVGLGTCAGAVYTSVVATTTVVVSAFNPSGGTFWYAAAGTGTTCSQISPCAITQFTSKLASNTQHNFNCESFTGTTGITISTSSNLSGVHIAAAGASCPGSCATINVNSGTNQPFLINTNGTSAQVIQDITISNICFQISGSAAPSPSVIGIGVGNGTLTGVYFDNDTCTDTIGSMGNFQCYQTNPNTSTSVYNNLVIWGGSVSQPLTGTGDCTGILGGAQQWYSIIGVTVSGNGSSNTTLCHQIYAHVQQHFLARWIIMGPTCSGGSCTPTRNYSIKTALDCGGPSFDCAPGSPSGPFLGQFFLTSENKYANTFYGRYIGDSSNDPTLSRYTQYVDQQNEYFQIAGAGGVSEGTGIWQPISAQTLTIRDALVCNSGDQWFVPNGNGNKTVFMSANIYRNKIYQGSTLTSGFDGAIVYNNITWNGATPIKQVITDNLIEDAGTSNVLVNDIKSSDWVTAGSIVDRNGYDVPNNSGANFLRNAGSGITFAAWKALTWDTNGSSGTNPGWPSPATCGFGPWPFN